jgi:hypothetical protein
MGREAISKPSNQSSNSIKRKRYFDGHRRIEEPFLLGWDDRERLISLKMVT